FSCAASHKVMTHAEWIEEGKRRFGQDFLNWKFQCPMCGHVASIQDFKDAGADNPNCAYQECIGRYTGKDSPKEGDFSGCNWAAYGLFGIPNGKGVLVVDENQIGTEVFDFADQY
ncbi:MAG: VVA0879 family protein, partial [Aminipila sp.]